MTLLTLQKVLQERVDASDTVVVSAATLTAAQLTPRANLDQLVRSYLVLGTSDLTLATTATVPAPVGQSLVVTGTADLLGGTGVAVSATFTASDTGAADVQVAVTLPAGWTLGSAFPGLAGPPFSELVLSDVAYVVTTRPLDSFQWNGASQSLAQESQLFSLAAISGPLAVAAGLLSGGTLTSVALTGLLDPSALTSLSSGLPVVALTGDLGAPVAITSFDLSAPRIEVSTESGEDGGVLAWLAFATTLSVSGQEVCNFKALLATAATSVTFALAPLTQPVGRLTPEKIISLLGVDYTKLLPEVMAPAFEEVALQGMSATFTLGKSIELVSIGARIGATAPFGYGQFQIEQAALSLIAMAPIGTGSLLFSFDAKAALFHDTFDAEFDVELSYDPGWGKSTSRPGWPRESA